MKPDEIKDRMNAIQVVFKVLEKEVKALQEQCPHPEFEEGLSIVACVAPVFICTTCGWAKPIELSGEDFAVHQAGS